MGILDNIAGSAESNVEYGAESRISQGISSKMFGSGNKTAKCPKCGAALKDPSVKFCPKCGAKLTLTCSKCKKDYPIGTKFCADDGTTLS